MSTSYGSKRLVVGAHYGIKDWLAQRITAVLMVLFTLVLFLCMICTSGSIDYERWVAIFAPQWMKALTLIAILSLFYHVWIGVRDVWMDYVKPVGLRLTMHVFTLVWLVGCCGWAVQVLWNL